MAASPLSPEQILALAPDASSADAGRKLATERYWGGLGRTERAAWGECQGSAVYQVRVDLGDLASKCSCPSRKFPCKHVLGLLLLTVAGRPPEGTPPEWVAEWLSKRAATAERKAKREAEGAPPVDLEAQAQRVAERYQKVLKGLEALSVWMEDLVRQGFAGLEAESALWHTQAARLVDAQAPGLAAQVRRLGALPGSGPDWPQRMLERLGRLALTAEAWKRLEELPPPLATDLRTHVGIPLREEDVKARGERLVDTWAVMSQELDDTEHLRSQRTWLLGTTTGRTALILQFAAGASMPFAEVFVPGTVFSAELVFWPSAAPQRAGVQERQGDSPPWPSALPSFTLEALCQHFADTLSRQPFHERTAALLAPVTPRVDAARRWWLQAPSGEAIRLGPGERWRLLALSGGHPLAVFGEWDGEVFQPLSALVEGRLYPLIGGRP